MRRVLYEGRDTVNPNWSLCRGAAEVYAGDADEESSAITVEGFTRLIAKPRDNIGRHDELTTGVSALRKMLCTAQEYVIVGWW